MDRNNIGESILQDVSPILPLHGHGDVVASGHNLATLHHIRNQCEVGNVALGSQSYDFVGDVDASCREEVAVGL